MNDALTDEEELQLTIVYCNDSNCLHWCELPYKRIIKYHKNYVPLGEDCMYSGICLRSEVGIAPREFVDGVSDIKHNVAICVTRSDKYIKGHMDFSRFPSGGHIDDDYRK